MNYINKDTKLYGSFSIKAGNNGCKTFNKLFQQNKINAIYKSFSVTDIKDAVLSARTLNFSGFAVSMPYKTEVLKYVDVVDEDTSNIGAANTIVNKDGLLTAYNTDYMAVKELLEEMNITSLYIIGSGGFAKAVHYACDLLSIEYSFITRDNFGNLDFLINSTIINCTPVENINVDKSNTFIDAIPTTETGKYIASKQAKHQYNLYTQ